MSRQFRARIVGLLRLRTRAITRCGRPLDMSDLGPNASRMRTLGRPIISGRATEARDASHNMPWQVGLHLNIGTIGSNLTSWLRREPKPGQPTELEERPWPRVKG